MKTLLVIALLVAALALSAESFRVPRQAVDVEEQGPMSKVADKLRSYYGSTVDTAKGYLDNIKGLKVEEKIQNIYSETTKVVSTYAGIVQDQVYHFFYPTQ